MTDEGEIHALRERAKELRCLYRVNEALAHREAPPHEVFERVLDAIPDGWQWPDVTAARIEYLGRSYATARWIKTTPALLAPIRVWLRELGSVEVVYVEPRGEGDPFLAEERILLDTVAARLGEYLEWKQQQLDAARIGGGAEPWRWRQRFAEQLAQRLDRERFGVEELYLTGSTESGAAEAGSDIDLVVVLRQGADRAALEIWLEGFGACLAEVAFLHTGYRPPAGLLDVHFATREWVARAATPLRSLLSG
jgi:hypothetical protein